MPQEVEYKYILRISDPKRVIWDLFVMLLAIWNSFSIPVFIAFEPEVADTPGMVACDFIIDFCFFTDILLNFRTSYISMQDGKEITNPKMIAINYVK